MSYTELHVGKLVKTDLTKKDIVEEYLKGERAKEIWKDKIENGLDDGTIDNIYEWDIAGEKYIILDNIVYEIQDNSYEDEDDIYQMKKDGDTLEYVLKFYNGGIGFTEALEDAYSNIKGK